jgi:hypothetical protein
MEKTRNWITLSDYYDLNGTSNTVNSTGVPVW